MVYQCEKLLSEEGDKFDQADKDALNAEIEGLKEALKGQDINLIKNKQEALQKKFYEVSEKIYKAAQGAQGAAGQQADPNMGGNPGAGAQGADGFYDSDYTDVTDDENK